MSDITIYLCLLAAALVVGIVVAASRNPAKFRKLMETEVGSRIRGGWWMFLGFGVLIAGASLLWSSSSGAAELKDRWLAYGEVYLGLDYTRYRSPMCDYDASGDHDNHTTSNGGIRVNAWQSASRRVEVNAKYTHHSCAFFGDNYSYDSIGFEITWVFFGSK